MRRQITVFLFCATLSFLVISFLSNWLIVRLPLQSPQEGLAVVIPPVPVLELEQSVFLTSYPCDCEGDRQLQLREPWLRGEDVLELQKILQSAGFPAVKTDGVFGPGTASAVQMFKKKHGLPADNQVDLVVWKALADEALPAAEAKTLPPPGEVRILVDLNSRRLTVYSDEVPYKSYPVAVGKPETPSPVGYFRITSKEKWGEGFGTRWLRLNVGYGIYGIHGTNKPWSIGRFESGGCIRMHNRHVEEIYEWVKIGTKVNIVNFPWDQLANRPALRLGDKNSTVMVVQQALKKFGYYQQGIDGVYGWGTQDAVKKLQAEQGFPVTGEVNQAIYDALGLFYFE